ncbi:hypothetical protein A3C21_03665 [Candidatus Kaiserbacteria bacterium RIFCSPHIGHO2_02_FULL_59_21]|uniref:Plasmid stabilization protein n=1 Tax=Candidatus Kaiserbacteria bacterium RIFCSPHIGHO2_02_FULL_59_21 TaxID=1798500 RepID=A0A1F6DZL7_9BACT|nr:MAG: hypothetical protein A2766_00160 [Candidatus Kaiserbacteria bacterium RIFCSPHIGHO2_01_FULL_58_22]OGG66777.1 MAG: hypothetical protein A3C21_03665 [Candidatus Kaiserbacteria bacterium RIFCSPHIGHO2_02_FULL_59_21]OGG87098.1 MAG: hypothetical protein A3I47_02430 [Candidatus Kaiserbacteria bacterium RIFCSPLOWO2_02_FULL_59_19]
MKVVFAEKAKQDISTIYDRLAEESVKGAQNVENQIRAHSARLGMFPYASVATDEPNVRRLPIGRYPYAIFCRIDDERGIVEIARVIHGARIQNLRRIPHEGEAD